MDIFTLFSNTSSHFRVLVTIKYLHRAKATFVRAERLLLAANSHLCLQGVYSESDTAPKALFIEPFIVFLHQKDDK